MAYAHVRVLVLLCLSKYCLAKVYKPPKITYPNNTDNLYYKGGTLVHITCRSNGVPPPVYKWFESDLEIVPSPQMSYDEITGVLEIKSFSKMQQLFYKCIATNYFEGSGNQKVNVSTMSPKIHLWEMHLEKFASNIDIVKNVTEYEYLVLPCGDTKASISPVVRYVWYNTEDGSSIKLHAGRLYIDQFGSLHFTYVLYGENRVHGYSCGISTSLSDGLPMIHLGTKHIINVATATTQPGYTGIKPQFRYSNTVVIGKKNASATMECVFSGYGTSLIPKQTWRDPLGVEYANSSKYNISSDGRTMTVHNLQEEDEKFYYCVAKNTAGEATSGVFLNVTSAPFFQNGPPTDKTGIQNGNVTFKCDAQSVKDERPPGPPVWFINSQKMNNNYDKKKFQLSKDMKLLTIKKLRKPQDIMCVQCQVENDVNVVTATACLNVILPITIMKRPPAVQSIAYGDTIDLTVEAITDPSLNLSYRWFIPNDTHDESNIPLLMFFDRNTKLAIINTTIIPLYDFKLMGGVYKITVFHKHESQVVETEVRLKDSEEHSGTPFNKEEEKETFLDRWLIPGIVFLVLLLLMLLFILCLVIRKSRKPVGEEEGEEEGKHPGQDRDFYVTEFEEYDETREDIGSEV